MTRTNKDFVVKNGLVVQGAQGTINGEVIVTEDSLGTSLGDYIALTEKGNPDGVATLDEFGQVPLTQLGNAAGGGGETLTIGTGLSGTSYNGSTAVTIAIDSTVVTDSGTQTLTNKTLTSPKINENVALTATATELNILDGATLSTIELNYVDGVTSAIQTQINAKAPLSSPTFTGTVTLPTGTVTSGMILDGTIVNGDINASAAIALSKLASGTSGQIIVANSSGVPTWVSETGDVTISDTGVTAIASGVIVDADVNASAAIAQSKISGLTSDLAAKAPLASPTFTGTVTLPSGTVTSAMIADGTIVAGDIADGAVTSGKILDGTIVNADINASAAIALSKLATDPLARASHTGTQTASTISDFDTQVRTSRLDQMAVPTADVSLNSRKITNLATPTNSTDATTKAYVDAAVEGLHVHASVKVATTVNVALATALENGDTLDGVTLATGDRILIKNQTTKSENGIYIVQVSGQPSRATDFDTASEVDSGDFVFVDQGTTQANTGWVQINTPAVIGTDAIDFVQFSGAGTYTAGNGLTLTGTVFSINTATTVDLSTAQTLTNKTLTSPTLTTPSIGVATGTSFNSITGLSSTTPIVNGTAAVGTATTTARADHVHPTDTSRAPLAAPTFTGTVTLPSTTSIGTVSSTEIGYLDGVTSAIQTQLDAKVPKSDYSAKGRILVGTGASTYASLAVGATNGHVLKVDSAQASGVVWGATPNFAVTDAAIGTTMYVGTTTPSTPASGDVWIDESSVTGVITWGQLKALGGIASGG